MMKNKTIIWICTIVILLSLISANTNAAGAGPCHADLPRALEQYKADMKENPAEAYDNFLKSAQKMAKEVPESKEGLIEITKKVKDISAKSEWNLVLGKYKANPSTASYKEMQEMAIKIAKDPALTEQTRKATIADLIKAQQEAKQQITSSIGKTSTASGTVVPTTPSPTGVSPALEKLGTRRGYSSEELSNLQNQINTLKLEATTAGSATPVKVNTILKTPDEIIKGYYHLDPEGFTPVSEVNLKISTREEELTTLIGSLPKKLKINRIEPSVRASESQLKEITALKKSLKLDAMDLETLESITVLRNAKSGKFVYDRKIPLSETEDYLQTLREYSEIVPKGKAAGPGYMYTFSGGEFDAITNVEKARGGIKEITKLSRAIDGNTWFQGKNAGLHGTSKIKLKLIKNQEINPGGFFGTDNGFFLGTDATAGSIEESVITYARSSVKETSTKDLAVEWAVKNFKVDKATAERIVLEEITKNPGILKEGVVIGVDVTGANVPVLKANSGAQVLIAGKIPIDSKGNFGDEIVMTVSAYR